MTNELIGRKAAIPVDEGFEQVELTSPRQALEDAGAETDLIAPEPEHVRGWDHTEWGETFDVDVPLEKARPEDYDLLLLPGGVMNPDHLRMNPEAVAFVRAFVEAGKPIAAICHGPWTLIEAEAVKGRRMTSYPSLKNDLRNAGAEWVDEEVVEDGQLITSRGPDDLEAFNDRVLRRLYAETSAAQRER